MARFRAVLQGGGVRVLVAGAAGLFAVSAGSTIAFVIAVERLTGSLRAAGFAGAAYAIGAGCAAPIRGRLLDRYGARRVCLHFGFAHALCFAGAAAAFAAAGDAEIIVLISGACGISFPPAFAAMNKHWADRYENPELRAAAFGLEAALEECAIILGPLFATLMLASLPNMWAFVAFSVLTVAATLLLAAGSTAADITAAMLSARSSPLRAAGVPRLLLLAASLGLVFGALQVGFAAFGAHSDSVDSAGLPLAALALGAAIGGLAFGSVASRLDVDRDLPRLFFALAGSLALFFLSSSFWSLLPLALLTGLLVGPVETLLFETVGIVAPEGSHGETFTWMASAELLGSSAGAAAAGLTVDALGASGLFLSTAAIALLAAATFYLTWILPGSTTFGERAA